MKKKSPSRLYVPLVFLIVFDIGFVLFSLLGREEAFFGRYRMIVQREWLGLPLYFLIILIVLFAFRDILKRKNSLLFIKHTFVFVSLFICAYHFSLFATLNQLPDEKVHSVFLQKNKGSLEEAAVKTIDHIGRSIRNYLRMDQLLHGKTLIVPADGFVFQDYYFEAFVHPVEMITQSYEYRLTPQQAVVVNTYEHAEFPSLSRDEKILFYRFVGNNIESEKYFTFCFEDRLYFISEDIVRQMRMI